ncbi:hypothetical protein [Streptosporangium sp. NPDC023615]|uniref:hypothetical protein n=1 Tax=Streptosporangium sp. NPDC023615 TaxID=3154794 RepID=UPI003434B8C1
MQIKVRSSSSRRQVVDPALHEGVHPWHPDTACDDAHCGIGRHGIEGRGERRVPITDEEPGRAADIPQVHDEAAAEPVGLNYRIRPLTCRFSVALAGDLVLVDEAAEDGSAVDVVAGEVDGD